MNPFSLRPTVVGRLLGIVLILMMVAAVADIPAVATEAESTPPVLGKFNRSGNRVLSPLSTKGPSGLYWYDGNVRRPLAMTEDPSNVKATEQVFVDGTRPATGRRLLGGVVVRLGEPMTAAALAEHLGSFGVRVARPVGASGRLWLLHSPPGLDGLALANDLHESGLVEIASPNWETVRHRK